MNIKQDDFNPTYRINPQTAGSKREFDEHVKHVNFQLNNVLGYFNSEAVESAMIKAKYLVKAANELEDYLKKHCTNCKVSEDS